MEATWWCCSENSLCDGLFGVAAGCQLLPGPAVNCKTSELECQQFVTNKLQHDS